MNYFCRLCNVRIPELAAKAYGGYCGKCLFAIVYGQTRDVAETTEYMERLLWNMAKIVAHVEVGITHDTVKDAHEALLGITTVGGLFS